MNNVFRNNVYKALRRVPAGKVVTYGQLASLVGHPKAARVVGLFMKTNPNAPHTPCHRVVSSDGGLTGYSGEGGIKKKKEMLLAEGVIFNGDKVDLLACQYI